jgi:hypothetical protein
VLSITISYLQHYYQRIIPAKAFFTCICIDYYSYKVAQYQHNYIPGNNFHQPEQKWKKNLQGKGCNEETPAAKKQSLCKLNKDSISPCKLPLPKINSYEAVRQSVHLILKNINAHFHAKSPELLTIIALH